MQKELSASNDVLAWYSVSKYQCGVLLINMNHVVCCCLMTRHTEAMATFASLNASVLALKPWKCYKEIVEFGGWKDSGRSWKTMKNLYKYISQRYRYASKIRSPKIQLVSYENSSISTSEKGHLTRRTITYPYYYAIHIYIYIASQPVGDALCHPTTFLSKISTPTNCRIRVSDGFWINEAWYSSTRWPSTLEDRSTNPSEGRRASGWMVVWVMPWGWSARVIFVPGCEKNEAEGISSGSWSSHTKLSIPMGGNGLQRCEK